MTRSIICFALPLLALATFFVSESTYAASESVGFSAELFHRDSYHSPYYNASLSRTEVLQRAVARSAHRKNMVTAQGGDSPVADLFIREGEVLMKIRLGTPALDFIGIADTGSELVWTQCKTCTRCVPHKLPLFDPKASSSYQKISCGPYKLCPLNTFCNRDRTCTYEVHYLDGFYTKGILATETLTIDSYSKGSPIKIKGFKFGCGNDQAGLFGDEGTGIIGLGAGEESLVRQLGTQKFSYCLIPMVLFNGVSRIHFGENAYVEGPGTVTLPMVYKKKHHMYAATLEAFTVNGLRIPFKDNSGAVKQGNLIFDSGSTLTYVPKAFYADFIMAIKMTAKANAKPDPHGERDLCFSLAAVDGIPEIVANFKGGDVPIYKTNLFARMSDDAVCLMMEPDDHINLFGFIAQQDMLVGYDYGRRTLSIRPTHCAYD